MESDEPTVPAASFGKRSMGYKRQVRHFLSFHPLKILKAPRKHQVWLPGVPSMEGFTVDNKEMLMNLVDTIK